MRTCDICGIPSDAGFFDQSNIQDAPQPGIEAVLASYSLHRNYCGVLMSFAQFTNLSVGNNPDFTTPGLQWQIRCNGQPRDPYLTFEHILNPWGYGGIPVQLRLEEGCLIEIAVRNIGAAVGAPGQITKVGGRITGRYWYNNIYGGVANSEWVEQKAR